MKHKKQSGFLILMAIIIITVMAILSASLSYLFISRTTSTSYLVSSNRSFYMSQAGIEHALLQLNDTNLASRLSCSTLNESITLGSNSASIIPVSGSSFISFTTNLIKAINSTVTTINIDNTSGLANTGRIYIDREAIDYLNNDTVNNQLSGITRGSDNTIASSHTNSTIISQFQCYIQSTGNSPSSPSFGTSIIHSANQSQTVIAVGENQRLIQWNKPGANNTWTNMNGSSNNIKFNAVDIDNAHQGWAVGNINGSNFSINRLNNGIWNSTIFGLAGLTSQNLNGVSSVSSQDAWAVGDVDGSTMTLLHWNGSLWSNTASTATPSTLSDIQVLDLNGNGQGDFGFSVGSINTGGGGQCSTLHASCLAGNQSDCEDYINDASCYSVTSTSFSCVIKKNFCINLNRYNHCKNYINQCTSGPTGGGGSQEGSILQYNGALWSDSTVNNSSNINQLNGISIIKNGNNNPIDAYAAGESSTSNGTILKWDNNGAAWNIVLSPAQIMHAISIVDTTGDGNGDYGWAVGENGAAYEYKNSSWQSAITIANNNDLFTIKVISKTDAWLAGANGARYHWNGSTWNQTELGININDIITSIAVVSANSKPNSGWREILN